MPGLKAEREFSQLDGYEVLSYFSCDDELFVAEISVLPGCAADGSTREEALQALITLKAEWISSMLGMGKQIPAPQSEAERILA